MKQSSLIFLISVVLTAHLVQSAVAPFTLAQFRDEELKKHNQYRSLHGCSPLTLNNKLNKAAQDYAKLLASTHTFAHSPEAKSGTYGENLYWAWRSKSLTYNLGAASTSWYNEVQYYDYSTFQSNTAGKAVGHFTAMIWKNSTQLGLGYAKVSQRNSGTAGQAVYIVANYGPTPNVVGQYAVNVPRPI